MADPYLLLGDFESYAQAQRRAGDYYLDRASWNRSCLINIAKAGRFAADRSVGEYARGIWRV